jgi:hypothetical protein
LGVVLWFSTGCTQESTPPPATPDAGGDTAAAGGDDNTANDTTSGGFATAGEDATAGNDTATSDSPATGGGAAASPTGSYQEPSGAEVYPNADFSVTADEFFSEHAASEEAWEQKYQGKVVEVIGQLRTIHSSAGNIISSGITATLETESDVFLVSLRQDRPWLAHPPGLTVAIRGRIREGLGLLGAAYIVGSQPGPPIPEMTPEELQARFTADKEALEAELDGKYVRIKGTLSGRATADDDETLTLGQDGSGQIEVQLSGYDGRSVRHWQTGDEVVVLGRYDAFASSDLPVFENALPVSPLANYPPLPPRETREIDGAQVPLRSFSAELLGRWMDENQRAFLLALDADPSGTKLEVRGEVQSVEKAEALFGDEVEVRLKDSFGGRTAFNLDKAEAEQLGVTPGVSLTVRGAPMADEEEVNFLLPEVSVE